MFKIEIPLMEENLKFDDLFLRGISKFFKYYSKSIGSNKSGHFTDVLFVRYKILKH